MKNTLFESRLIMSRGTQLYKCLHKNKCHSLLDGVPSYWSTDINKLTNLLDFFHYQRNFIQDFLIDIFHPRLHGRQ